MKHQTDYPEDTETTLYFSFDTSLGDIIYNVRKKWGDIDIDEVSIFAEHRHVRCLTYDRYDPSDYIDYIVVKKI